MNNDEVVSRTRLLENEVKVRYFRISTNTVVFLSKIKVNHFAFQWQLSTEKASCLVKIRIEELSIPCTQIILCLLYSMMSAVGGLLPCLVIADIWSILHISQTDLDVSIFNRKKFSRHGACSQCTHLLLQLTSSSCPFLNFIYLYSAYIHTSVSFC